MSKLSHEALLLSSEYSCFFGRTIPMQTRRWKRILQSISRA
jgi:hypothetical protein